MYLVADSGSTKTAWCLIDNECNKKFIITQGINPFHQSEGEICALLHDELLRDVPKVSQIDSVYFYGAGCTAEKIPVVRTAIRNVLNTHLRVEVNSDLLGAARSLCGHESGVVCILGTGSNSCYYDGDRITGNVSPLGYILGDEGSGAYIGKRLVGDCLKHQLPEEICELFYEETHLTASAIIQKVYCEQMPNRFLASLSPFCARHRDNPAIHEFLVDCFREFFLRNVMCYKLSAPDETDLGVYFVGSIAYFYRNELSEAANMLNLTVKKIVQTPLEGLVDYHSNNL